MTTMRSPPSLPATPRMQESRSSSSSSSALAGERRPASSIRDSRRHLLALPNASQEASNRSFLFHIEEDDDNLSQYAFSLVDPQSQKRLQIVDNDCDSEDVFDQEQSAVFTIADDTVYLSSFRSLGMMTKSFAEETFEEDASSSSSSSDEEELDESVPMHISFPVEDKKHSSTITNPKHLKRALAAQRKREEIVAVAEPAGIYDPQDSFSSGTCCTEELTAVPPASPVVEKPVPPTPPPSTKNTNNKKSKRKPSWLLKIFRKSTSSSSSSKPTKQCGSSVRSSSNSMGNASAHTVSTQVSTMAEF